jgi:hypothetical protein
VNVLLPCARLLLAAGLLILFPVLTAALGWPVGWLLAPLVVVSAISCVLQGYRRPAIILACIASNALMLGIVYLISLGVFALLERA